MRHLPRHPHPHLPLARATTALTGKALALLLATAAAWAPSLAARAAELTLPLQSTGRTAPAADAPAEIQAALQRYARNWYEGNAAQLAGVLHPDFTRQVVVHAPGRLDAVETTTGLGLLDQADRGLARNTAPAQRKAEVSALEVAGGVATAWLALADHQERVQLVRWNNEWRLLQVLSERTEKAAK